MTEQDAVAKKKILVIDDEPNVVAYLETLLQDSGYETATAVDGEDGMGKVKSERPDLICLDITMLKQSGIRFYRNLKDDPELADIPVVVVTAVTGKGGDPEPFKRFLSTRQQVPAPEAFFPKPLDRQEFLEAVAKILS